MLYRIETADTSYQVVARDVQTAVNLFHKAHPSQRRNTMSIKATHDTFERMGSNQEVQTVHRFILRVGKITVFGTPTPVAAYNLLNQRIHSVQKRA